MSGRAKRAVGSAVMVGLFGLVTFAGAGNSRAAGPEVPGEQVLEAALASYACAKQRGEVSMSTLTVIDYSLPSTARRLWVLDAETGVVMLLYLTLAHRRRSEAGQLRDAADLREAIVEGAAHRIRPKLMTVLCLLLGLAPILWSDGAGADVMKRIAAPMVGGLITSFFLELTVYPAIFAAWKDRSLTPLRRST